MSDPKFCDFLPGGVSPGKKRGGAGPRDLRSVAMDEPIALGAVRCVDAWLFFEEAVAEFAEYLERQDEVISVSRHLAVTG